MDSGKANKTTENAFPAPGVRTELLFQPAVYFVNISSTVLRILGRNGNQDVRLICEAVIPATI